jgi:hypothetical protein
MTYLDLITNTYILSGVKGEGETLSPAQAQAGLYTLSEMIDAWSADNLSVYTINILMIPVQGAKSEYTVGPSGDFNVPVRPPQIEAAWFRQLTATPYVDVPIYLVSELDWGNITSKGITGNLSQYGYYDQQFPLSTLHLWPIPNSAAGNIIIHAGQMLNSSFLLTDTVNLPPAYRGAIRFNLARLIAAENGIEPSATVVQQSVQYMRLLEENNGQIIQRMTFDSAAYGATGAGRWMIQSDSLRI